MKIYFAASNHNLEKHLPTYSRIVNLIDDAGHTLVREWLQYDQKRQQNNQRYTPDEYRQIWREVKEAIIKADLVIIEASENTYSIGYQTALALSHKKPVLVLTTGNQLSHTIIAGENNPLLTLAPYADDTLASIINVFFDRYEIKKQDLRFNMLLDRETQVFLDLQSYQTGKTKARLIRDLIRNEMRHKDGL